MDDVIVNPFGQAWLGRRGETTGVDARRRVMPDCSFLRIEHHDGDLLAVRNGYGQSHEYRRGFDGMILRDGRPFEAPKIEPVHL